MIANNNNINYPFYIWFDEDSKEEYYTASLFLLGTNRIQQEQSSISLKFVAPLDEITEDGTILKHPSYRTYPNVDRIGSMLIRLLNADLTSFESAYNTFFYAYGFDTLNVYMGIKETKTNFKSIKEFKKYHNDFFKQAKIHLSKIQKDFREAVDILYNLSEINEYSEFSPKSKIIALLIKHETDLYTYTHNLNLEYEKYSHKNNDYINTSLNDLMGKIEQNEILKTRTIYSSQYLGDICYCILNTLTNMDNILIKKCKRCGRYFIPNVRNDEIYCDIQNIDGSSTCRELGAKETYKKNLENVPALLEYRRSYQKKLMYCSRNKDDKKLKKDFDNWRKNAQSKIKEYKNGKLNEDELLEWMNENK